MKKLILLFFALLTYVSGAWATVTVYVADGKTNGTTHNPIGYFTTKNGTTLTTTASSGLAGVVISNVATSDQGNWNSQRHLTVKPSAVQTAEKISITAPEGYLITGYSISCANYSSSQPYKIDTSDSYSDATAQSVSTYSTYKVVSQTGLSTSETGFWIYQTSADQNWLMINEFTITLEIDPSANIVNVTYALYETDGETFVSNNVAAQEKNSAISLPSAISSNTYFDYVTSGTIGETDCTIKVTRTIKTGVIYPLTNLSNDKKYTIKTKNNARSALSISDGYLASPVKTALSISPKDFAILSYEGNYYLYSVDDEKFVTYESSNNAPLADCITGTSDRISFSATTAPLYELRFDESSSKIINSSASYTYGIVINGWGASSNQWDDGCQYSIEETGDFDPTDALAVLEDFFHPSYTVTYIVKDGSDNTLFTSDPVGTSNGANITTLPAEYQLTNFYTYNNIDLTISSSGNTDAVFTATPKAEPLVKYTADTSNPYYYNLNIRSMYLVYNSEATGEVTLQASSEPFNADASWAFIGEPYTGFKVINKTKGTDYFLTYTSIVTGNNSGADGSNNNVQFVASGDFNNRYWIIEPNTGGFCMRMKENTNIYFHHQSINNQTGYLRTCSVSEWSGVHNDAGSTIVASTDEEVLIALYNAMNSLTYSSAIGQYSAEGYTTEQANTVISDAGTDIANETTGDYASDYAALQALAAATTLNTPAAGFYRLRNVATDKYLVATALASNYADTNKYVFANGNASDAATVIMLTNEKPNQDAADGIYMYNQGYGFGWTATNTGGGVAWVTSSPDKYVNLFPGTAAGRIAFAICLGNGTGGYASYLKKGIYTANGDEEVVAGTDETLDAAQWLVEAATEATVSLHSDGAGTYYATFCAPFSYTVSEGTKAYTLDESGNWLVPTEVVGAVPAGTPVLLKGTEPSATLTIYGTDYVATPSTDTDLTGTYLAKTIDGADYVLGIDEGGVVGFYHWNSNNLGANRAYVIGDGSSVKGFVLSWDDETGIKNLNVNDNLNKVVYDLSGRRIQKPTKGLYIVNGKKVMVK